MSSKIAVVLVCLLIMALPAPAAPKALSPVGDITFETTSVALGATFTFGRGWLTFQGRQYPIKVEGLGLVGVGVAKVRARGKVYNLKHPSEINGSYIEAGAGVALIGGVKGFTAKNDRGVIIDISAEQEGVSFNVGGGSFTITMTRP